MGAATLWFGAELRARWRAMLGLALLVGVVAGACLAAAAGARRTDSAYPRFLAKYGAFHTEVSTGGNPQTDQIFDEIAHLPQVVATSRSSLFLGTVTARRHTVSFPDVLLVAPHEAEGFDADGVKVVRGRLADPDAVDEAVAGYAFAERLGLSPGDTITVSVASPGGESGAPGTSEPETEQLRLVGAVAAVGGFETLTGRGFPNVVGLTPAFFRAHRLAANTDEDTMAVALRHGDADLPAFADEIRRREIPISAPPQPASVYTSDVQAVNRVPVVTLWAAAGLLALAVVAISGQALARETLARGDDFPTLRALGMSRAALTGVSMAKGVLVAAAGAAVAVGVAVLASPLMPLGLARIAEPDPGFATDWLVLGIGAAASLLLISAVSVLPAHRAARRADATGLGGSDVRPAALAGVLARAGLPTSMTSGVRLATGASRPGEPVPVRTAFVGTSFSIAAVTAALVFASSLGHLVEEPRLFGYSWDAAVIAQPGRLDDVADALPRDLVEDSWKGTVFASVHVEDLLLQALASEGPPPSIIKGRSPEAPDEIALDPKTLDRLDKGLGDTVSVAGTPGVGDQASAPSSRRMRIVGSFAVPRLPFQSDENPGQGAAFTPDGLASIAGSGDFDALQITVPARRRPDRRRPEVEGGDRPGGVRRDLRATCRRGARRRADLGCALVPGGRPRGSRDRHARTHLARDDTTPPKGSCSPEDARLRRPAGSSNRRVARSHHRRARAHARAAPRDRGRSVGMATRSRSTWRSSPSRSRLRSARCSSPSPSSRSPRSSPPEPPRSPHASGPRPSSGRNEMTVGAGTSPLPPLSLRGAGADRRLRSDVRRAQQLSPNAHDDTDWEKCRWAA